MELNIYNPQEIESKWYSFWETNNYFQATFKPDAENYCIQLPPPNITGTLHMGHAFQHTIMDTLIRYHRMRGYNTLWQPGTDHAGISTQIVVERQLEAEGSSSQEIGREQFLAKVWQWKKESGDTIVKQMKRLGSSCDWSRLKFTMDSQLSAVVNRVFIKLYQKGLIYKGTRLVNWDVKRKTAVSDLEVSNNEEMGSIWYIKYYLKDSTQSLTVATTRPETMLGDVAVAVHPQDARYQNLIGKFLILPLVGREIPIIGDDCVDPEFASGCVKITPAHDFNDYQTGIKHQLPIINIMNLNGTINDNAPAKYQGLERFAAREVIIADLAKIGLLLETKDHKLKIPRGERDDIILEPILTTQWFVKMNDMATDALNIVKQGEIHFIPENWKNTYDQWLNNIQDWCISRQLWWGHRIPAFYDQDGNIYVAENLAAAQELAPEKKLLQDPDVLDTWFSSALWCFSTLGWPESTVELKNFLPSNVLVTGFDIIFFWVARMIMLTQEFTATAPFKEVYITGLIRDNHGNKMSKSKGNVIDPLDLIDGITIDKLCIKRSSYLLNPKQKESVIKQTKKDYPQGFNAFGADALRFNFLSFATHGRDLKFDVKRIESSGNFCNKLFNATKFTLIQLTQHQQLLNKDYSPNFIDQWIIGELGQLISEVEKGFKTYRFDLIATKIYEFIWNQFCDWYLELAKINLNSEDIQLKTSTINTLFIVLETSLRILHPLIPFISEELWQALIKFSTAQFTTSIMIAPYPVVANYPFKLKSSLSITRLKEIIGAIRNLRAEMNLNPALKIPLYIESDNFQEYNQFAPYIKILTKISVYHLVDQLPTEIIAPIAVIDNSRLMLEVEIDQASEQLRIKREIIKHQQELHKLMLKLANLNYQIRAPQNLVQQDQARVNNLKQILAMLEI